MKRTETLEMGVVVERRESDNRWIDHEWLPVAVVPRAPALDPSGPWRKLTEGDGWVQYHAGTLAMEVHRSDVEAYLENLASPEPAVYVVLRKIEEADTEHEVKPFAVTVSPYEAQDYTDSGEEIVERVPMPEGVAAWLEAFVAAHPAPAQFRKRRLRRRDSAEQKERPRYGRGSGWSEGHEF